MDLDEIIITGALGKDLNINHAQQIGLIPSIELNKIRVLENGALIGASELIFSLDKQKKLDEVREKAEIINLANWPKFESVYMNALYLRRYPLIQSTQNGDE